MNARDLTNFYPFIFHGSTGKFGKRKGDGKNKCFSNE
jgi:hypothetical protein